MTRLPNGSILAIMRENSFVFEPMYYSLSHDEARTWSYPRPTPLIGHRPCLGLVNGDQLLITYRNVAPDCGTAAWMGTLEELDQDFMVHARRPSASNPVLTPQGLLIENESGGQACVRYALRPMTDPELAWAELSLEVLVERAEAGVTWSAVAFPCRDRAQYLENVDWFARDVIAVMRGK